MRTILQPHNILLILEEVLSKKGNLGYINFFKSLKGNDFDRDNHLYFKEWVKCLKEQRISIREDQMKSLFDSYSVGQYRMNYELLLEKLVPTFDSQKTLVVKELYDNLFREDGKAELSFYRVSNAFLPR